MSLARLAGELAGALGAGDIETARTLAARIGEALAPSAAAPVVDLAAERARRAGSK